MESGPDPIIWILPSVRPDKDELSATIVRDLATGDIKQNGDLLSWIDSAGSEVSLGTSSPEARDFLARDYPTRVRLTVGFMRALAQRRHEVISRLKAIQDGLTSDKDTLSDMIDKQAIRTVEEDAASLWPYLRRISEGRR